MVKQFIITVILILTLQLTLKADYIKAWYICGPFLNDKLDAVCFKNEGKIIPGKGVKSGGKEWKEYLVSGKNINFEAPDLFGNIDNCNSFASVEIISSKNREAVLLLGSDDGVRIWLNRKMILNNDIPRALTLDQDRINIKLKKGKNYLTFKVNDQGGGWELAARIVSHNEQEIKDLKYIPAFSACKGVLKIKNSSASSFETHYETGEKLESSKAFDNDKSTRWSGQAKDPQWIMADLGKSVTINKIKICWESAFATSYEILTSNNKRDWKRVYFNDNGSGGEELVNFKSVKARYVKLNCMKRALQFGYSIFEIMIYKK